MMNWPLLSKAQDSRSSQDSRDPRWETDLYGRFAAGIFSVISISLFAAAVPRWDSGLVEATGSTLGKWQDIIPIVMLGFSFFFNVTNIVYTTYLFESLHRIARLVGDALICASFVPAIFFAIWHANFRVWRPAVTDGLAVIICTEENKFARECFPNLYEIGSLELGAVVFSGVVWLVHLMLFLYTIYAIYAPEPKQKCRPRFHDHYYCHNRHHKQRHGGHRRHRHRRRRQEKKERIFVRLDGCEYGVKGDFYTPYHQIVEEVRYPGSAMS
uniref:Uncharacterized protein n=1 Tax=Coccidioides posadasii RMSCC 3488 TaxID=454284 RepID=A0A0J6I2G3_COCPO|nr:hypothetical protein CPAG_01871 [Coccidioides posadasii RMSCC 3488]